MHRHWIVLLLTPLLAACASVPQYRYYTLDMSPRAGIDAPITVESVRISVNQALARPEILVRTSPTQIEYYALDRWAGGLDEQIDEKLKTEFGNPGPDPIRLRIDGMLMAFEQVDTPAGAEVRVKIDLSVEARDGQPIRFTKLYYHSQPASAPNVDAVVEALSRAVEAIATEIAADVQRHAAAAPAAVAH